MQFLGQLRLKNQFDGEPLLLLFMCQNNPSLCDEWDANADGNKVVSVAVDLSNLIDLIGYANMRKIFLSVLVLALVSPIVFAEIECTDRPECWPEGSSMHTGLLLVQQQKVVEKLLASKHDDLIKLVSSSSSSGIPVDGRLLAALKTQQAAWLKYRAEECELIGSLTGAGGTWPSTYANKCELNHSEQRLRRVRSAIRCIEKIPLEKRPFEQNNCLQQLAPLTNK
jgi:uncharacterized protein YecT (DUF1311 family)